MPISQQIAQDLCKRAQEKHDYARDMLVRLIAAGAETGGTSGVEGPRAEIVEQEMRAITGNVYRDAFGNICGAIGELESPTTTIWFIGHFDTVAKGEWEEAFTPKIEGNKLYGRGSSDQLAGLVASIAAMSMLKNEEQKLQEHKIRMIVMGNPHEEDCEGESIKYLLNHIKDSESEYPKWLQGLPQIMLTTEPTSTVEGMPRPYFGHRGRYLYQMRLEGPTGHASIPLKVNVAEIFAVACAKIFATVKGPESVKFGLDTYAFTTGKLTSPSFNAHTEVAAWNIDLRIAPTSEPQYILEQMKQVGEETRKQIAEEKSLSLEDTPEISFSVFGPEYTTYHGYKFIGLQELPGPWLPPQHPLRKTAMDIYRLLFNTEPAYDKKNEHLDEASQSNEKEGDCTIRDFYNFSTDLTGLEQVLRNSRKTGAEAPDVAYMGLGAGIEEEAHTKGEYCPLNSLDHAASYYAALVLALKEN